MLTGSSPAIAVRRSRIWDSTLDLSAAGASLHTADRGAADAQAGAETAGGAPPQQDEVVEADYEIVDDDKSKKS